MPISSLKAFSISLALLTLVAPIIDAEELSEATIDKTVVRAMKAFEVPGIAVGIVRGGKLTFAKGYGVRSVDTGEPVTPETLYGVASNTKAMTVAALAMLVDKGTLNWDDKVTKWIPEFKLHDDWVTAEFTIRDMLSHRSGLPLGAGDLMWWPNPTFSRQEVIEGLKHLKPTSSFRSKYDYDNLLYIVAGEIVTRASGIAWEDFIEQNIFKPIGMDNCRALPERVPAGSNVATPHMVQDGKLVTTFFSQGEPGSSAAAVNCNITGMARWMATLLNGGKLADGTQVISSQALTTMWSAQTNKNIPASWRRDFNTHFFAYGLGFNLMDRSGAFMVQHSGGLQGMVTYFTMLPEKNMGIIVLTNQMNGAAMRAITDQILDGELDTVERDWVQTYADMQKTNRDDAAKTIAEAATARPSIITANLSNAAYAGTYIDAWYGDIKIIETDGKLRADFTRTPLLKGTLEAFDGDNFIIRWDDQALEADSYIRFELEDGKVVGATMEAVSPLTDFSFDFHHLNLVKK